MNLARHPLATAICAALSCEWDVEAVVFRPDVMRWIAWTERFRHG